MCSRLSADNKIKWENYLPLGFEVKEAEEWHKKFIAENPDLKVSKEKFKEFFQLTHPDGSHHKLNKVLRNAYRKYDPKNTGKMDFSAFLMTQSFLRDGDFKLILASFFEVMDKNHDHFLTGDEIIHVVEGIFDIHGVEEASKKAKEVIEKADVNTDKKLSKKELIDGIMNDPDLKKAFLEDF